MDGEAIAVQQRRIRFLQGAVAANKFYGFKNGRFDCIFTPKLRGKAATSKDETSFSSCTWTILRFIWLCEYPEIEKICDDYW